MKFGYQPPGPADVLVRPDVARKVACPDCRIGFHQHARPLRSPRQECAPVSRSPIRALQFQSLRLNSWRNFRAVEMNLAPRVIIVGPNASGKSNLLDVFRFLSELARPGSGGLQAAIDRRGGFSALRCLQARTQPQIEIEVVVGLADGVPLWSYKLEINKVRHEKFPTVVREIISHNGVEIQSRSRKSGDDALEFSQTLLEQVAASKDFRDLVEFFASCRYLHVVPQIVRDRRRAVSEGDDPYGGDLLRRMKDMPKKTRLPRLTRIGKALRAAVPQFLSLELDDDAEGVPHLYAKYDHWRAHATKQRETAFSDGTLRLIGLLWSIGETGGPLLLEEPELSLNDAVVSELPTMFARMQKLVGRQVILTTHSSALLDDPGIGLREVHYISVEKNGSSVKSLAENPTIFEQTRAGMTVGQAILPILRPRDVSDLAKFSVPA